MSTRILIIAHAPLASALRDCAMHVFPDCAQAVVAIDVPPYEPPEDTLATAMQQLQSPQDTLVLTDVMGATPANVAQKLVQEDHDARLIAGVNPDIAEIRAETRLHETAHAQWQRRSAGHAALDFSSHV